MEAKDDSVAAPANVLPDDSSEIHGIELQSIKEQLLRPFAQQRIIPISGMGGIEKTTLARAVYEDPIIKSYFDVRAWTTVSQRHDTRKTLREILCCVDKSSNDNTGDSKLAEVVRQRLICKRYLIVVDDVWTIEAWDELRLVFPDQENGSSIIVTTRENEVAKYVLQGGSPVCMSLLTSDKSLKLLISSVFGQQPCPSELEKIARVIASKCQGLPLAIDVIGGVLADGKTADHWSKVAKDVSLSLGEKSEQLLNLLALSFDYLPQHLKPCFLYLGIFPKDSKIHVPKLINMWVAEGFIKAAGSESLEEIAKEYLEDLMSRNLVLCGKKSFDGRLKTCVVHGLLHDLILREAKKFGFFYMLESGDCEVFMPAGRHTPRTCIDPTAHSYFYFGGRHIYYHFLRINWCLKNFLALRVLHIDSPSQGFPPDAIAQLIHLRYLAASFSYYRESWLQKLPPHLETLINFETNRVPTLGWEICKMPRLRHLKCYVYFPHKSHQAIADLANLQTLFTINIAACAVICGLHKLRKLYVSESAKDDFMTCEQKLDSLNCLKFLTSLQTLKCKFRNPLSAPHWDFFPTSLEELTLANTGCPWEGMRTLGKLPHLKVLKLKKDAFVGLVWELTDEDEDSFPELRLLWI